MMTREDIQEFLMTMQSFYQNYKPVDKTLTVNIWLTSFQDCTKKELADSFVEYVKNDTSGFAPVPGKLRQVIMKKRKKVEMLNFERLCLQKSNLIEQKDIGQIGVE